MVEVHFYIVAGEQVMGEGATTFEELDRAGESLEAATATVCRRSNSALL